MLVSLVCVPEFTCFMQGFTVAHPCISCGCHVHAMITLSCVVNDLPKHVLTLLVCVVMCIEVEITGFCLKKKTRFF